LTVGIPPVITQQPQDVGVAEGGTAVFSVTATDATTYQWYFYDSPILGANAATYTVNNASYRNSGPYRVVVSNVAGSVHSVTVFLDIYSGLQAFTYEYFAPAERENNDISGHYADPDGDGLANLLEYALGFHPRQATAAGLPEAGKDNDSWTFTYTRPSDIYDVSYTVEASTDLVQWSNEFVWVEWLGESDGYALLRAHYPSNLATKVFFRLRVSPQMPTAQ
ncbi:MAG: immunoglobulin domain-containing protein, partial [Candidatus Didemnitutus sp.]|nr:immunoglobulin domain-containing protein [Candidatus Didemnitutus sp.]